MLAELTRCVLDEPSLPPSSKGRICDHGALHHLALLYSGAAAARVHTFLTRLCAVLTAPDKPTRWVAAPLATAAAGGAGGAGGAAAAGGHAALRQLLLALVRARARARARVS